MTDAEPSMESTISDAFDAHESPSEPSAPSADTLGIPENTTPVQTDLGGLPPAAAPLAAVPNEVPATPPALTAPQSWGVAEREAWASVDPSVQAQIDKRERETQEALTKSGDARAFQDEFHQITGPYEALMAAEGATPMQAVQTLLTTAATLQSGSPQAKAQRIAELVSHYGVDIRTLDGVLSGQMPEDPQQSALQQMMEQQMAPMNQFMSQFQQQQQQQYQQSEVQTQNELQSFMDQHEFSTDVRMEMADLMEMSSRRNESMTLDQAYEKAILLRPDIQQVIGQRTAAANATQNNQSVQQKRQAAVSVPGGEAMTGGAPAPSSMRDALEQAMGDGN